MINNKEILYIKNKLLNKEVIRSNNKVYREYIKILLLKKSNNTHNNNEEEVIIKRNINE